MSNTPRGRPTIAKGQASASVHCRLPNDIYQRTQERATRDRTSVQDLLRRGLQQVLDDDDDDGDD